MNQRSFDTVICAEMKVNDHYRYLSTYTPKSHIKHIQDCAAMVSPFKVDLVFLVERVKVQLGIVCAFVSAQGDTLAGGH